MSVADSMKRMFGGKRPADDAKLTEALELMIREAKEARDASVNAILEDRIHGLDNGMRGVVQAAQWWYTPQNWKLPPYNLPVGSDASHLVYPYYFSVIQQILPGTGPRALKLTALPQRGDKKQISQMATAIFSEELEELKFNETAFEWKLAAKQWGTAIAFAWASIRNGFNNIERKVEICDPLAILIDPMAKSLDDAAYIIYRRERLISDVQAEYDLPSNFKIEPKLLEPEFSHDRTVRGEIDTVCNSAPRCVEDVVFTRDPRIETKKIMGAVEQDTVEEDGTFVAAGTPVELGEEEVPVYPNGRITIFINGRKVHDSPNPFWHQKSPFVVLRNHSLPKQFYGMPEWLAVGDAPHVLNESVTQLHREARTGVRKVAMHPQVIEEKSDEITTDPTQILTLTDEGKIAQDVVKSFTLGGGDGSAAQNLKLAMDIGEVLSGVSDAYRGVASPNVTSGKQQQGMAEQSGARVKLFTEQFGEACEQLGYMILMNAAQFRDPEETLEIASNGIASSVQEFKIDSFPRDVKLHVKIVSGSGLPTDRQEKLKVMGEIIPAIRDVLMSDGPDAARIFAQMLDVQEVEAYVEAMIARLESQQVPVVTGGGAPIEPPVPQPLVPPPA